MESYAREYHAKEMEGVLELVDAYWKFDENQQPMSTWHDKQDLLTHLKEQKQDKG